MCLQSHRQLPVHSYGRKVKAANGLLSILNIPDIGNFYCFVFVTFRCGQLDWRNICQCVQPDSYSPAFQATKNRLERTPINFRCRQPLPYNCDFDMCELKRALSSAHNNTSPGPDGMSLCIASPFERGFTSKSPFTYSTEYGGSRCILLNGKKP
ncbi:hypothetical protein TNCV_1696421 [Trichonephila clavipes]|nr:hypothetical protein TNCV_1696421 [Trichonephila clavipes]